MTSTREYGNASDNPQTNSATYDAPEEYQHIDDVASVVPVDGRGSGSIAISNGTTPSSRREGRRKSTANEGGYNMPDDWVNLDEIAATSPVENATEAPIYTHQSLEQIRSRDQEEERIRRASLTAREDTADVPTDIERADEGEAKPVSKLATQFFTLSYLIFFAIFGTLARVGLTALTTYSGTPVLFSTIWSNFGGSLVMGFLSEDRMLFREEWGTPTYDQLLARARKNESETESGSGQEREREVIDLAAAKKAHLATKKTIPLYIGLATGFCGSFTSFSSFVRDMFLAMSNQLQTPGLGAPDRNGGYSFMALAAVIITTISLSMAGLFLGAHLAIALERVTPSFPYHLTRKFFDPLAVVLGWGCWLGAVLMAIFPPHNVWRGEVLFSLIFGPLGCFARFYLSVYLNGKIASFPLGTFAANIIGTAVLGMSWDIAHAPIGGVIGCQVLQGVEDGFCGCLTTISTWVAELSSLKRQHAYVYGGTSVLIALAVMVAIMGGLRWSDGFSVLVCVS